MGSIGEQILGVHKFTADSCAFYRWYYNGNVRVTHEQNPNCTFFNEAEKQRVYNIIKEIFEINNVDSNSVQGMHSIKNFYHSCKHDKNGFIVIFERDNNYPKILKSIMSMAKSDEYYMQAGMLPNSTINKAINGSFMKFNGGQGNIFGCLHVKKRMSAVVHRDFVFLFGVTPDNQKFVLFRLVDNISNSNTWEVLEYRTPKYEKRYLRSGWKVKELC